MQYNIKNIRKFPVFDTVDSTPISEENEPYHLKLCFCPLCQKGMIVLARERSRNVISWQYICKVIFYCLSQIHKKEGYFSLKYDVHWFIVDHWYLFSQLEQFRTNPNKWKKAILDAMIHCNAFESGKSTVNKAGVWKLKKYEAPWEFEEMNCHDHNYNACNTLIYLNCCAQNTNYNNCSQLNNYQIYNNMNSNINNNYSNYYNNSCVYNNMNNSSNNMSTESSQVESIRNNTQNNYQVEMNPMYIINQNIQNQQVIMNNYQYQQNNQLEEESKNSLPAFDSVFKVTIKQEYEDNISVLNKEELENEYMDSFIQKNLF